MDNDVRLWGRN